MGRGSTLQDLFTPILGNRRGSKRPEDRLLQQREVNLQLLEDYFAIRGEIGDLSDTDRYLLGQYSSSSSAGAFIEGAYPSLEEIADYAFLRKTDWRAAGVDEETAPPTFLIDLIEGSASSITCRGRGGFDVAIEPLDVALEEMTPERIAELLEAKWQGEEG